MRTIPRVFVVAALSLTVVAAASIPQNQSPPQNPDSIIQRSLEVIRHDRAAADQFDYLETDGGKNGSKTFAVSIIAGSPYRRLTAIGGAPVAAEVQKKEEQKEQRIKARRCAESSEDRQQRISAWKKEQESEEQMIEQMSKAFTFRLVGEPRVNGRATWELEASPRPGYRPPTVETRALTGMEGKLWIDQTTYQWVKVECEVVHPVSIAGFLARVEPGTRFELEKGPVSSSVWMPTHFAMNANAQILAVFGHHSQEDDSYSAYHLAGAGQSCRK